MDRDKNRWDRVATAYEAMFLAKGPCPAPTASAAVTDALRLEENDELSRPPCAWLMGCAKTGTGCFGAEFPRRTRPRNHVALAAPDFDAFDTARNQVVCGHGNANISRCAYGVN